MFEILEKKKLSEQIIEMVIRAERIAAHAEPGQFIILRTDEEAERIPLTIADFDREKGTVTIVFQIVGAATLRLSRMEPGDAVQDFTGPLGNPSDFIYEDPEELKKKKIVFIGGGVGTAPVYPQAKWFFEHGIRTDVIIGARTRDLIMYEDKMREVAEVHIATDDGTYGFHGNTCDMLKELLRQGKTFDKCVAIGPTIMMKFVCLLTKELGIPTVVSMNPIMVDGTGMCGACRLTVDGKVRFACVDGPEFDGHLVNFDEVMKRMRIYKTEEGRAYLREQEGATHHGGCGNCSEKDG